MMYHIYLFLGELSQRTILFNSWLLKFNDASDYILSPLNGIHPAAMLQT